MDELRCECPTYGQDSAYVRLFGVEPEEEKALDHPEGACPGDHDLALYQRSDEQLWLCSMCCLIGDVRISRNTRVEDEMSALEKLNTMLTSST